MVSKNEHSRVYIHMSINMCDGDSIALGELSIKKKRKHIPKCMYIYLYTTPILPPHYIYMPRVYTLGI